MSAGIEGKVILILGGAGGIGSAAAGDLAARGARIAVADIDKPKADIVANELTTAGAEARAYKVDIIDKLQVHALVQTVLADFGRIDVLINAAGVMFIRPLTEINTTEWEATIDLNVKGSLWGVAAVLPVFLRQQSGHIVNLGSVHGLKVFTPGGAVHSASKFAIRAFTEGLRAELASSGIQNKTTGADSARMLAIYRNAIPATAVSGAILYAIAQPDNVDVNEFVIRPTAQEI